MKQWVWVHGATVVDGIKEGRAEGEQRIWEDTAGTGGMTLLVLL